MARPVTLAVVFFLALNLFSGVLMSTGAAATLGISAEVGGDQATDKLRDKTTQSEGDGGGLPTGSPSDGTLFGLYNVIGGFLAGIFQFIFPGLNMLSRAGVPDYIIGMLGTIFSLLITIDIAAFVRGYEI
jgi:hypothetical protein